MVIAKQVVLLINQVPENDGKSNGRYVSCSKPSLHRHKAPLGADAL